MHLLSVLSRYKLKAFRGNVSDDDAIELADMGSFHVPNPTSGPSPSKNDGEGACSQSGKRSHATNRDREHPWRPRHIIKEVASGLGNRTSPFQKELEE